jgi:S-phase kinase-associated protein 1
MKNETDDWSANFVDIPLEDLVNLTKGASYMGIRTLVDLCCAKLACMCMDKSEEEIFNVFNINETLTEEEKQRLREENKWIENNFD